MIDFAKELDKFKPINEIDDIEDVIAQEELQDIMDLLKEIINNKSGKE